MPEAKGAELFNIAPSAMTAEQRQEFAALLLKDAPGALLRQGYHVSLGFAATNEAVYARRYGWGTDRRF